MRGCDRFGGGATGAAGNGIGGGTADGGPDTSVGSRRSSVVAAITAAGNGGGRVVDPARAIGDATAGGRVMLAARIAVPGGRVGLGAGRPPGGRVGLGNARPPVDTPPLPPPPVDDGLGPDWFATPSAPGAPNKPTCAEAGCGLGSAATLETGAELTGDSAAALENGAELIGDCTPVGRDRVGPENADGAGPDAADPVLAGTPDDGAGGGASASSFVAVLGPIEPLTSTVPVSVGPLFIPFGRPGGGAVGGFVRGAASGAGAPLAPMIGFAPVTRPARAGGAGGGDVGPERVPLDAVGTPLDVRPDAAPANGLDGAPAVERAAPSASVSSSVPDGGSSQPAESCATRARVSSAAEPGGFVGGDVRFGPDAAPFCGGARSALPGGGRVGPLRLGAADGVGTRVGPDADSGPLGAPSGASHPEARSATRALVSSPIRRRLRSSSGGGATQPPYHTPVLVENRRPVPIPLTHSGNSVDMRRWPRRSRTRP